MNRENNINSAHMKILSIVVAVHNLEDLILNCINSIKKSLSDCEPRIYEVLLIDDSSSDSTPSILKKFAEDNDSFIYIRKEFKSLGKVKKYSVEISNGEYITFVDGDDFLSDLSMGKIINFIKLNRPDMLISSLQEVRKDTDIVHKSELITPILIDKKKAIKDYLIHKKFQAQSCGKFFRTSLFKGNNFPEVSCYEDALSFPSILMKCNKIYYTKMKYYNYIKRENSLSSSVNAEKVSIMSDVVLNADMVFGKEFRRLNVCHAIDIIYKYEKILLEESYHKLLELINGISTFYFLMDPNVRLSFKRKLLKIKINYSMKSKFK